MPLAFEQLHLERALKHRPAMQPWDRGADVLSPEGSAET